MPVTERKNRSDIRICICSIVAAFAIIVGTVLLIVIKKSKSKKPSRWKEACIYTTTIIFAFAVFCLFYILFELLLRKFCKHGESSNTAVDQERNRQVEVQDENVGNVIQSTLSERYIDDAFMWQSRNVHQLFKTASESARFGQENLALEADSQSKSAPYGRIHHNPSYSITETSLKKSTYSLRQSSEGLDSVNSFPLVSSHSGIRESSTAMEPVYANIKRLTTTETASAGNIATTDKSQPIYVNIETARASSCLTDEKVYGEATQTSNFTTGANLHPMPVIDPRRVPITWQVGYDEFKESLYNK